MRKRKKKERKRAGETVLQIVSASLFACIATAAAVILLALMLRWEWFALSHIPLVNTLIKALSAAFAGFLIAKRMQETPHGWSIAGCAGSLYILLSYIVFSLIERDFSVTWFFVSDLLTGFLCAATMQIFYRVLKQMRARE